MSLILERKNIVKNLRGVPKSYLVVAVVALGTTVGLERAAAVEPGQTDVEAGMQVLTRGPVHEAFAETVTFDPKPGIVAPKAPPAQIEELPPEQKPEGANVAWISGYWGWDDDRNDFLWVSGIWRDLPPGRQWVSGYWGDSGQGYRWTAGYWADAKASDVGYLSEPPESREAGPNIDAPSADHSWIPGCWVWHQARYVWRPGSWVVMQPDWVWVPDYYVWTPRGYVFIDGYYDYSVARRGVLFAPVYFDPSAYSRPGFSYSPTTVINLAAFTNHLFLRPSRNHYYFGDYYAANYRDAGFYPRFSFHNHNGYDPIYAHDRWQHRRDRAWEHRQVADFRNLRDHEESRPPHTWAAQRELSISEVKSNDKSFVLAAPLAQLAESKDSPLRFQSLDKNERQELAQRGREVQKLRAERQEREINTTGTSAADISKHSKPARMNPPTSPIVAKPADEFSKGQAPPKRYGARKPNLQVQRKPNMLGNKRDLLQEDRTGQTQPGANRPDVTQPGTKRPDSTPWPTAAPGSQRVNRSSEQPRPYTSNRLPLDAEQPQPNKAPRADQLQPQRTQSQPSPSDGASRPGDELIRSSDTTPFGPRGDTRVEQSQPQSRIDLPPPRVDRPAPQTQPQRKAQQPAQQRATAPAGGPKHENAKGKH